MYKKTMKSTCMYLKLQDSCFMALRLGHLLFVTMDTLQYLSTLLGTKNRNMEGLFRIHWNEFRIAHEIVVNLQKIIKKFK